MLCGNLVGSILASTIMVFFIRNAVAIWLGSALLGMSYASTFPTLMTWMSETLNVTGKKSSVIITGGALGIITIPSAIGVDMS